MSNVEAHAEHAARRLRMLSVQLSCLPPSSLVILRTPYYVANVSGSSSKVCLNVSFEHARVAAVRDVMVSMHRAGEFGARTLLLDAYELTREASHDGAQALRSLDGHHYGPAVRRAEWQLLSYAFELALNASASPSRARLPASCESAPRGTA